MRRFLPLILICASCKGKEPGPATPPLPPDAAVADVACKKNVAELADWMAKLAAAGRVELDFSPHLAEADLPAAWVPETDSSELRPGFAGAWDATVGIRDYLEDKLADRAAMEKRMAEIRARRESPDDDGQTLRADVDRDEPWSAFVDFAAAARAAGYTRLNLVLRARLPMAPPPPSALHELLAKGSFEAQEQVWKRCKAVTSFYYRRVPGKRTHRERAEEEAREVPKAIESCGCAVTFDDVREYWWVDHHGNGNGSHRSVATLALAAPDDGAAPELTQPAAARWREALPAVLEAARAGKPVRPSLAEPR